MKKVLLLIFLIFSNAVIAQQDCDTALSICGNSNINYSPIGFGNVNESLGGCLAQGGENNSVWYKFQVATSGTLTFVIAPTSAVDYDWAVYGPNVTCASKGTPIRCNAAGTFGNTGLNLTSTITTGAPGSTTPFCKYLDVIAGETYYLFIDNWVGGGFNSIAPFTLTWGGTATLADPFLNSTIAPNPFVAPGVAAANPSDPREILICAGSFSFDFTTLSPGILNNNQNFVVTYHLSSNDALTGKNPIASPATVTASTVYYYSIKYQDPNGNTSSCRQIGSFKFIDKSINVNITSSITHLCPGDTATLTSSIATGNTWSNGATTQSITVSNGGTYTLTNSNGTCSSTASVNLTSSIDPNVQISGNLLICDTTSTVLTATATGTALTYLWSTGATTPSITVNNSGNYTVTVKDGGNCSFSKTVSVVNNSLVTAQNASLTVCSTSSPAVFNLTTAQPLISTIAGVTYKFYQNQADAIAANTNTIVNPATYTSANTTVYVLLQLGQCSKVVALQLNVTLTPVIVSQPANKLVCAGSSTSFSVSANNSVGYQWQVNTGSGFTDLTNNTIYSGVTTNTLTIANAPKSLSGYKYKVIVKSGCVPNLESVIVTLTVPEVSISITQKNVTCNGAANATITTTVSGGNTPYTYLWSNGATTASLNQLAPGTYTVKVTDANGCFANASVTITQPVVLSASLKSTNVSCKGQNNGTAEVTPSGGTAPYTYLWSHNNATTAKVTGLSPGVYSVEVKDTNNCSKTEQVTITEPNALVATITHKNSTCFGSNNGEAIVNVVGGTAPYTYLWSTSATTSKISQLPIGQYTVKVTDANGCVTNSAVTITEPTALQLTTNQVKAGCNGATVNSVITTVSGGTAPYSYAWSNGLTTANADNISPGSYVLSVTDANGCKVNQNVNVVPFTNMVLTLDKKDITCNGAVNGSITANVSGGKTPYVYSWSTGATTQTINNLNKGVYTVIVTDGFGCSETQSVTVLEPTSLTATHSQVNVTCFGGTDGSLSVVPTGGTAPYSYAWSNGAQSASVTNLTAGNYTVLITDVNGCAYNHTMVVTQSVDVATPITSSQLFCLSAKATVNDLVVTGSNVKWYNFPVGGTPLKNTDVLLSGNYYASQTINGCESVARTGIQVTIQNTNVPVGFSTQDFCSPFVPKIADLTATGSNIKWFDKAIGGNLLNSSTVLVNGSTYYASQTVNGCESTNRLAVKVTIYPNQPITTTSLVICDVATLQDISLDSFSSAQLKWYASATSTQELPKTQVLVSGTYYVSTFTNNMCESVRKPIQVSVSTNVPVPTVTAQAFCDKGLISDLVIGSLPGAKVYWYDSFQSTTPLAASTALKNGTYYVEQEIVPCKSARVAVAVRIYSTTAPVMTNFVLCDGATVADLYLAGSTNLKYVWFVDNVSTSSLPSNYALTTGYYYVAIDNNGCISNRTSVHVQVNSRPSAPTGSAVQSFTHQAKASDLVMNQPNITWYLSYTDAINRINALDANDLLVDGTTYYGVIIDANGCPSYPTPVKVNITLGVNNLDIDSLRYYPNPIDNELTISYHQKIDQVEIYSITGQRIFSQKFDVELVKIDFSRFNSGAYMVRVSSESQSQFVKVIKK